MIEEEDQSIQLSADQKTGLKRCGVPDRHIDWAARNFRYGEGERLLVAIDNHRRTILGLVLALACLPPLFRFTRLIFLDNVQLYNQFLFIDATFLIFLAFFLFPFERAWDFRQALKLKEPERTQLSIRMLAGPYHEPGFDKGGRIFTPWISKLLFLFEQKSETSQMFYEERIEQRARHWRTIVLCFLTILIIAAFSLSNRGGWLTDEAVFARSSLWPFQADRVIQIDEISHVRLRCENSLSSTGSGQWREYNRVYYDVEFQDGFFINLATMRAPDWNRTDILYNLDQRLRQSGTRFSHGRTSQRCLDRRATGLWADILHTTPQRPARPAGK